MTNELKKITKKIDKEFIKYFIDDMDMQTIFVVGSMADDKYEKCCGCIILKNDAVLLIGARDRNGKLFWSFPKGHQEAGETDVETALRETKEEVGLDVKIIDERPIATMHYIPSRQIFKRVHLFIAEPLSEKIVPQEEELECAEWTLIKEAGKHFGEYYNDAWKEFLSRLGENYCLGKS